MITYEVVAEMAFLWKIRNSIFSVAFFLLYSLTLICSVGILEL